MRSPSNTPAQKPARDGFSLLELLISVVILSILVAILLPVMGRMGQSARASSCVSNLKQIGVGLQAYISDHNGTLIPCASIGGSPMRFWFDELNPYMGGDATTPALDAPPYKWVVCPEKKAPPDNRQVVGYGWNHTQFGYTSSPAEAYRGYNSKILEVSQPANTIIIADSLDIVPGEPPPAASQHRYLYNDSEARLSKRHLGHGNYLMLDGHVETYTPGQIVNNSSRNTNFRKWRKKQ